MTYSIRFLSGRKFGVLRALTAVFILTAGCSEDGADKASGSPSESETDSESEIEEDMREPQGRLRVEDGRLVDERGRRVTMTGLSLGSIGDLKALGQWNASYFERARNWGAKLVRLPVNPSSFRMNPEMTLADLEDAVSWCTANELYLSIDYHVIGSIPDELFLWGHLTASTWDALLDFWDKAAARFADEPYAAFAEIYNEPSSMDWLGGVWTAEEWKARVDEIVQLVRKRAPDMIPLVAGFDFAYDFTWVEDLPFADPNIALAVHPYPNHAWTDREAAWDEAFGYLADRYPMVLTEFGFDPHATEEYYRDDVTCGREIVAFAAERHISWTAFVFFRGPGWPMALFYDWDNLTPTVSGAFFLDLLDGVDLEAAGKEFDAENPPVDPGNGPSGMWWQTWSEQFAGIELPKAPTPASVEMHIDAAPGEQSGLAAFFDIVPKAQYLGEYNELVFDADITDGKTLVVVVGLGPGMNADTLPTCTYFVTGRGRDEYVIDLTKPDVCVPLPCFEDLRASQINFLNAPSDARVEIDLTITSLALRENPDRSLPEDGNVGTCDDSAI